MDHQRGAKSVTAYIGLGSNLDQPVRQLLDARAQIASGPGIREIGFSRLYRSKPLGPQDQPDFVNAVIAIETDLPARDLLHLLQRIETEHGRLRNGERWGPRTLDLDILLYGNDTIATPELTVPHPGIADREFVLAPLLDIDPQITIPNRGAAVDLLRACDRRGLPMTPLEHD